MAGGMIYMVQPIEYIGTLIYKIGCSKDKSLKRCSTGYGKGTRYIVMMECDDPFALERKIKETFNKKFKLFTGKEYFEGDENEMRTEFLRIAQSCDIIKDVVQQEQCANMEIIQKCNIPENVVQKKQKLIKINYYCGYCEFEGEFLPQIKQHLSTKKHIRLSDNDICITNYKSAYKCSECAKIYNDKSNLHRHLRSTHIKSHADKNTSTNSNVDSTYEMIEMAMNENNAETKVKMMKMIKMFLDEKNKAIEIATKIKYKELELASKINDIYENKIHKKWQKNK
jgi:hypothetical protein